MHEHVIDSFVDLSTAPLGAVVGSLDQAGELWAKAVRFPGQWKVAGVTNMHSDRDAWNFLEGDDGCTLVLLSVDETLTQRSPAEAIAIIAGEPDEPGNIHRIVSDLAPGCRDQALYPNRL